MSEPLTAPDPFSPQPLVSDRLIEFHRWVAEGGARVVDSPPNPR